MRFDGEHLYVVFCDVIGVVFVYIQIAFVSDDVWYEFLS